jgi:hypothetical protein
VNADPKRGSEKDELDTTERRGKMSENWGFK